MTSTTASINLDSGADHPLSLDTSYPHSPPMSEQAWSRTPYLQSQIYATHTTGPIARGQLGDLGSGRDTPRIPEHEFATQLDIVNEVLRAMDLTVERPGSLTTSSEVSKCLADIRASTVELDPTEDKPALQRQLRRTQASLASCEKALAETRAQHEQLCGIPQSMKYGLLDLKDLVISQAAEIDSLRLTLEGRSYDPNEFHALAALRARFSDDLERAILCVADGTLSLTGRGDNLIDHIHEPRIMERHIPWGRQSSRPVWL